MSDIISGGNILYLEHQSIASFAFSETSVLWGGYFYPKYIFKLNPVAIPFATAVASLFLFFDIFQYHCCYL